SRAANLFEVDLNDPARAFDILLDAWPHTMRQELQAGLLRLVQTLAERTQDRGAAAAQRMVAALRDKAEKTWEGPDKAETLIRAAELEERFLHDAPAALRTAQEAVSAAAAEEDARVAE